MAVGAFERENSFRPGLRRRMHGGSRKSEREHDDFRGAAKRGQKLRMACREPAAAQWAGMHYWKTLDREMTVPSGFWCLELGVLILGRKLVAPYC